MTSALLVLFGWLVGVASGFALFAFFAVGARADEPTKPTQAQWPWPTREDDT